MSSAEDGSSSCCHCPALHGVDTTKPSALAAGQQRRRGPSWTSGVAASAQPLRVVAACDLAQWAVSSTARRVRHPRGSSHDGVEIVRKQRNLERDMSLTSESWEQGGITNSLGIANSLNRSRGPVCRLLRGLHAYDMCLSSNALTSSPAGRLLVLLQSSQYCLLTANELANTIQLSLLQPSQPIRLPTRHPGSPR